MVLISSAADAIPYSVRVLGDEALAPGGFVRTGPSTYVHLGSVRETIIEAYLRHRITADEFNHYTMVLTAVYEGRYFDNRFCLSSVHDPRIRMNIVIWLEEHGDLYPYDPDVAVRDEVLEHLEAYDEALWRGIDGEDMRDYIPDEDYVPEVVEVVDLTHLMESDSDDDDDDEDLVFHINVEDLLREDDIDTISLLSDLENIDPNLEDFQPLFTEDWF